MHSISVIAQTAAGQGVGSHELALLLDLDCEVAFGPPEVAFSPHFHSAVPLSDDVNEWLQVHRRTATRPLHVADRQWQPFIQRLRNIVIATHYAVINSVAPIDRLWAATYFFCCTYWL